MLASQFLEKLSRLKVENLDQIKGFGPILATNLKNFVDSDRFLNLKSKLENLETENLEINIESAQAKPLQGPLLNQTICITGSFEQSRDLIKQYLSDLGAKITDSVTKKTTILLVGSDPGSKVNKAQELGINIFESVQEIEDRFGVKKTQT